VGLPWCPAPPDNTRTGPGSADPRGGHDRPSAVLPWLPAPGRTTDGAAPSPRAAGPRSRRPGPVARRALSSPGGLPDVVAGLGTRRLVALLAAAILLLTAGVVGVRLWTGGHTVSTPFVSYTAPARWTAPPEATGPLDAAELAGVVHGPGYACGGQTYVRGFAAAALLPVDPARVAGPADRAERLARWFAATAYATSDGAAPEVTVAPPRAVRVRGPDGPVDGTVTELTVQAAARGGCPATTGTVLAVGAPAGGGAAVLLVAGDTAGGPADPAPADRATLDAALASVRLVVPPVDSRLGPLRR
jgi:hypothetical protein